jgi:hypothetical protein
MSRLLFMNLGMLAGLAGLAIPILIHLLLRRRRQRLRFSTVQFFQRQDEQSSQRRKLRNWLLLAVRLLLLTLLVLAFARPFLPQSESAAANRQPEQIVFVVDRSLSTQAIEAGAARWQRMKNALRQALGAVAPQDQAALVSCGARTEILSNLAPPDAVLRVLDKLEPGAGTADLGEGLQIALKLLAGAAPGARATLCVVSDLQLSACKNLSARPLPNEVTVKVINVGDILTPNLAVADLRLGGQGPEAPHALVMNFSDEEDKSAKLVLSVDGKEALTRALASKTGLVTRVELPLPALAPGWHQAEVKLEADDALALDNARYETFFVPRPLRVWVVETRTGKRVFEEESFFIRSALDPLAGATNGSRSQFTVEKMAPEALARQLASATAASCDVVILPGLKQVPTGLARALAGFAQGGGGVLLFLGDEVGASHYNQEFQELLPATLGHLERNTAEAFALKWHLDDYDLNSPVFAVFRAPNSGNLSLVEFRRRFSLTGFEGSQVTARFEDGVPALAGKAVGRGRVALANTSADTGWTDWPKHKTFVPWLHQVCRHLGQASNSGQALAAQRLVTADDAELALGTPQKQVSLRRLGGPASKLTADAEGRVQLVNINDPGIYLLQDQDGRELQRLVVNLPAEESDLTAIKPAEFLQRLTRSDQPLHRPAGNGWFGSNQRQKELWRLLLLGVLGLLLGEVLLANRTYA